jgi:formylglycine-generating enzyme required for sulfatase activity
VLEEQGHGVFTHKLLDGLQGHADTNGDGIITGTELAAWMHPRVAQASDNKQDMQFGNLDGEGQFFFLLPQAASATPSTGTQVAVGIYPQQPQAPPATIVGNDGAEMVLVPAGEFIMECGKPRHQVYLARHYDIVSVEGDLDLQELAHKPARTRKQRGQEGKTDRLSNEQRRERRANKNR